MSIFKETFKDHVFTQLKIREGIIQQGNSLSGASTDDDGRFGEPNVTIKNKNGDTKSINVASGAFYTMCY